MGLDHVAEAPSLAAEDHTPVAAKLHMPGGVEAARIPAVGAHNQAEGGRPLEEVLGNLVVGHTLEGAVHNLVVDSVDSGRLLLRLRLLCPVSHLLVVEQNPLAVAAHNRVAVRLQPKAGAHNLAVGNVGNGLRTDRLGAGWLLHPGIHRQLVVPTLLLVVLGRLLVVGSIAVGTLVVGNSGVDTLLRHRVVDTHKD